MSKKKDMRRQTVEAVAQALLKQREAKRFAPLLQFLGLDKESVDRLTELLLIHLILDRGVTALLTDRLREASSSYLEIEKIVAKLNMTSRIKLLAATRLITDGCAEDLHNVNEVRNNLAHYQPTIGYDMSQVKELSSEAAFR